MRRVLVTTIVIIGFVFCCIISKSCANTTTPPSGGPKDTIPPVLLKITPQQGATGFPRTEGTLTLLYDEYTVIKSAGEIFLSPPTKKRPIAKVKGKNIVVTFQDTLQENKTYTLDFGTALADNNEGNLAPRLVFSFTTGDQIDSMYCTGTVIDSKTLQPVKGALVSFYSDLSDSACILNYPDAATKSDDWGYFVVRNIKPIPYNVYALMDLDGDFKFSSSAEMIAFIDTAVIPTKVIRDSIYELGSFNMKDTLLCKNRESDLSLSLFNEMQVSQFLLRSGRISEKMGYLKFNARDVELKSFQIFGVDSSSIITQFNPEKDSMNFWIKSEYKLADSLLLKVNYLRTDSLGKLVDTLEDAAVAIPAEVVENMKKKTQDKNYKPDTVFTLKIKADEKSVEQEGIVLTFDTPVIDFMTDSIALHVTNPKNQTTKTGYTITQDSIDIRNFFITPTEKLQKGHKYKLVIPYGSFTNLDYLPNKEATAEFELPDGDKLSSLTLEVTSVDARYIVELVSEDMKNVYRKYNIEEDATLSFPYLEKGNYCIRITQDRNKNGLFDTGNLLSKRQPEKVVVYTLEDGTTSITIPETTDLIQTIDLKEIFK